MAQIFGKTLVGTKTPDQMADEMTANKAKSIMRYMLEAKRRAEYEWYINDQFYNNNQYLKYNVAARRVQAIPAEKLLDKVVINMCFTQVRAAVAFLNREHPTVAVLPGAEADDAYLRARKEKRLIDYWYDHLQLNRKIKLVSKDGVKFGVGAWKILWNKDAAAPTVPYTLNGETTTTEKGEVMFERIDPFDMLIDPIATDKQSMRYWGHIIPRTIGELQANPLYTNTDKISPDQELAASPLKQSKMRQEMAGAQSFTPGVVRELENVIVAELYWKEFNKQTQAYQIRLVVITKNAGIMLRNEIWPIDEFPVEFFQCDIAPSILETKGVIHNIREPNRALNQMMTQIHENAKVMGKINWLIPRGSNVNVITDETGQFIEYDVNPGGVPHQVAPTSLPSYIPNHVTMLRGFINDIGGSTTMQGKSPFAQASGELVNSLAEGDQNNLSMMRDNLDDFLVRSFKLGLKTAKVCMTKGNTRTFRTAESDVFGQYAWEKITSDEISTEDDLQVRSGTNMPYSLSQKQDMFLSMWKEKLITDPSAILKLMEMPDVANGMGDDEADIERQLQEIKDAMSGKPLAAPVIMENHSVHIATIDKFAKSPKWRELTPEAQAAITDHRGQHIDLSVQLANISASMQVEPIKRTYALMVRPSNLNEMTPIERTNYLGKFGVQSDAAQIMMRGGLTVQQPADAELQAQGEDMQLMDMKPVQVSPGDNHEVHIQVHLQVVNDPSFEKAPRIVQDMFNEHIKSHVQAMKDLGITPGLIPDANMDKSKQPKIKQ